MALKITTMDGDILELDSGMFACEDGPSEAGRQGHDGEAIS